MILGVWDRDRTGSELAAELVLAGARAQGKKNPRVTAWHSRHLAFTWIASGIDTLDEASQPFTNADQTIVSLFEGKIYNASEVGTALGLHHAFDKSRPMAG